MNFRSLFATGLSLLALNSLPSLAQEVPAPTPEPSAVPATFAPPSGPPLQTRIFEVRPDFFAFAADPDKQSEPADPFASAEVEAKSLANIDFKSALSRLGIGFEAPGSMVSQGPGRWEITLTNTAEELENFESVLTPMGADPPRQAHVQVEVFSMPPLTARKALITHPKESDLHTWLDAELAKPGSSVKLERHSITMVRGGQRAKTEGIAEIPRPTKYRLGLVPRSVIPQAFESRHAGDIFEVELTFGDGGQSVDLNLAPETTRRTGTIRQGANHEIHQPIFETQKSTAQAAGIIGKPMLISTFSPPVNTGVPGGNTEDRTWLLFVTVTEPESPE